MNYDEFKNNYLNSFRNEMTVFGLDCFTLITIVFSESYEQDLESLCLKEYNEFTKE